MTTDLEVSYPYDTVVGWVSYPYDKALLCYRNRAFSASYGVRSAGMSYPYDIPYSALSYAYDKALPHSRRTLSYAYGSCRPAASYPYDMHTGVPGGHSERALTHRFRFNSQASHGFSPSRLHAGSDPQEQGTHPSVSYPYDNPGPLQPDAPALLYADDTVSFGMARPDVFSAPCYVPLPGSGVALSYPYDRVLLTHRSRTLSQGYEGQGSAVSYPYDIQPVVLELAGSCRHALDLGGEAHDVKCLSRRKAIASILSYAYDSLAVHALLPAASVWSSALDVTADPRHSGWMIPVSYAYDTGVLGYPIAPLSYPYNMVRQPTSSRCEAQLSYPYDRSFVRLQALTEAVSYPYDKSDSVQASFPTLMSYAYDKALLMFLSRTLPYAYGSPSLAVSYPYDTAEVQVRGLKSVYVSYSYDSVNFADGHPGLKPLSYGGDLDRETELCSVGSLSYPYDKPLSSPSVTSSPFMSYPYDVLLNVSYAYDKALLVQHSRTLSHAYESRDTIVSYPYDKGTLTVQSAVESMSYPYDMGCSTLLAHLPKALSYPYDNARSVSMMSYAYDKLRQGDLVSYPYDIDRSTLLAHSFIVVSYPYDTSLAALLIFESFLSYPYDKAHGVSVMSYAYDCRRLGNFVSHPYDNHRTAVRAVAFGALSYPYDNDATELRFADDSLSYPYDKAYGMSEMSYPYDIVRSTLQVHSTKAVSYPYDKQPGLPWPPGWALPDVVALRHRKPHQTQPLPPRNQIQTKPATRRVFLCLEKSA